MDADNVASMCAGMKLTEEESVAMNIAGATKMDGMEKLSLCLVGKLLTSRLTNRDPFRSLIARIWRTTQAVEVETVGDNVYAFHFQNNFDRKRVLMEVFQWTDFWIQIHNVPLICMSKNIGLMLEKRLGKVKDIDVGAFGDYFGKFLRVKISVDVKKPLKRILCVKLEGMKEEKILLLKYERLLKYSFCCSLIGHSFRECPNDDETLGIVCNSEFAFRT
ncbi:hypothetical protein ACOSP7_007454 [Xanthoceras sorbifolium]